MPVQLPATEEARSTPWSSADRPSALRLASPHLPIEFQGLRLRRGHTLPTATQSHNHVCPALPSERSHAESSARRSTANSVGAAHLSDIAVRSLHPRDQPSAFQSCAEIGETLGANCRYRQPFVSKAGWQASAQTRPHLPSSPVQWTSFHCAVARGSHARFRHRAPASVPRPHRGLADNGSTPPVTVGVWRMFIAPRRQRHTQRRQRASPRVERIAGEVAAFLGTLSPF